MGISYTDKANEQLEISGKGTCRRVLRPSVGGPQMGVIKEKSKDRTQGRREKYTFDTFPYGKGVMNWE